MTEEPDMSDGDAMTQELLAARRRVIEAGDTARQRLARDLHDGAQQQFVTALISLRLAQRKWDSDATRARELLDNGVEQADSGLATLRELVAGIHPPVLAHLGLAAAVEASASRLPFPVRVDVTEQRLPGGIEVSVYFFVSEALTNVLKHAQASSASVQISVEADDLRVEVGDDGIGGARPGVGSGLVGLADRVGALNGQLDVASTAESGTTLSAQIPLSAGAAR
jgi:signal transduction histidine kinase